MVRCGLSVVVAASMVGCAATAVKRPAVAPEMEDTPVPTVPPSTPTPEVTPAPLATRPVSKQIKAKKGQAIGPVVTFFGAARADGNTVEPTSVSKDGVATYTSSVGSGFMIVVEAKPGESGAEVARRVFDYVPDDPKEQPDLQIESNRDLGNGSKTVCDRQRPNVGGMPGISPVNFSQTQHVSDALNDFACRFETFIESESSCTMTKNGDFSYVSKDSGVQFCMMVARAYQFPVGETVVTVRLRDVDGNFGPTKQMRILHPADAKKDAAKPAAPKAKK